MQVVNEESLQNVNDKEAQVYIQENLKLAHFVDTTFNYWQDNMWRTIANLLEFIKLVQYKQKTDDVFVNCIELNYLLIWW